MNIVANSEGREKFSGAQQKWTGDEPALLQRAWFAGQEMIATTSNAGAFVLMYLGFDLEGFDTMETAKAQAPTFARKVLARLSDMIAD